MSIRGYVYMALAILIGVVMWRGGVAIHNHGIQQERSVWLEAQAKASEEADARRRAAQASSDAISDATRDTAEAGAQTAREEATTTIERIRYVYRDQPAPDCPAPAVPVGVREELSAAYDATRAAARGLPAGPNG